MMNIIPEHSIDYKIPEHIRNVADELTAAILLNQTLNEYIIPVEDNGELLAALIRDNGIKVYYKNNAIHLIKEEK